MCPVPVTPDGFGSSTACIVPSVFHLGLKVNRLRHHFGIDESEVMLCPRREEAISSILACGNRSIRCLDKKTNVDARKSIIAAKNKRFGA
jgi:hypothetical protein